jgi:hypothetical protein
MAIVCWLKKEEKFHIKIGFLENGEKRIFSSLHHRLVRQAVKKNL